jgi:hypothetical protein
MTTIPNLSTFVESARECALQMMSNASYMETELAAITLPEGTKGRMTSMCESLIATKHDVISELVELSELSASSSKRVDLNPRIERIIQWLLEPIMEMHQVVKSLQESADVDARFSIGSLLVVESATSILNAFNSAKQAADAYRQQLP